MELEQQSEKNQQTQQQQQQQHKSKNLPNLGKHLLLDFVGIQKVDVNSYTQVHELLSNALTKCGITIYNHSHKIFEPQGLSELFLLDHGHLTIHTWPEEQACAIDFYHSQFDNWDYVKKVEEHLCDSIGWECCTSTLVVPRGKMTKLQTNSTPGKTEIFNQVSFVHREKSQYQDIRIYDTQNMGRILTLDGYVQITDQLEDKYTVDMTCKVLQANKEYENVLILGGGDLLIANYILNHFPLVKKITLCELDGRVIECVKQFFKYGETIKNAEQKINVILQDGSSYVQELAKQNIKYDAIIIDCTDTWDEGSPAYSLTTVEFYMNLKKILKPSAKIIQQLSDNSKVEGFKKRFQEAGFNNIQIVQCETPQYGENLPLGILTNSN